MQPCRFALCSPQVAMCYATMLLCRAPLVSAAQLCLLCTMLPVVTHRWLCTMSARLPCRVPPQPLNRCQLL